MPGIDSLAIFTAVVGLVPFCQGHQSRCHSCVVEFHDAQGGRTGRSHKRALGEPSLDIGFVRGLVGCGAEEQQRCLGNRAQISRTDLPGKEGARPGIIAQVA
jgi:hypothetical protein